MKWTSDTLSKIRDAHDIVEWIGRDTVLKASSQGQYTGLCPFPDHKEKTPSFSVSSVKQVYHCFGCKKGGDLFTYFRDQKSMSFSETVQYLARQAGISLESGSHSRSSEQTEKLFHLNLKVADLFHKNLLKLPRTHVAHKYLKERGYSEEIIKNFRLGYAPFDPPLSQILNSEEKKTALKVGLLSQKENQLKDLFRHRLMFPIFSPMDKVLGFGGRAFKGLPKYINSRDSVCFQKGQIFYGLKDSASFIRQKGYALIVEGYTDYLTLYQQGFQNVVATLGVALTPQHARLLKRYTDKVVLFFDGDVAGRQAAFRSLPILLHQGLRVHYSELKGMDPDECIREKGVSFLKDILKKNGDLFLHIFSKQLKDTQGVERLDLVLKLTPILNSMKDQILKEYYKKKILDVFLSSEQSAVQMIFKKKTFSPTKSAPIESPESSPEEFEKLFSLKNIPPVEIYLLALALSQKSYLESILSQTNVRWLSQEGARKLFKTIFDEYSSNPSNFDKLLAQISSRVEPAGLLHIQSHPALMGLNEKTSSKFIQDCLWSLSLEYEKSKLKNQVMQLKLQEEDKNRKSHLKEIQKQRQNISRMERGHEK